MKTQILAAMERKKLCVPTIHSCAQDNNHHYDEPIGKKRGGLSDTLLDKKVTENESKRNTDQQVHTVASSTME